MVGRTRLYRRTGSPLIRGATHGRRNWTPWIVAALIVIAASAAWVYLAYIR